MKILMILTALFFGTQAFGAEVEKQGAITVGIWKCQELLYNDSYHSLRIIKNKDKYMIQFKLTSSSDWSTSSTVYGEEVFEVYAKMVEKQKKFVNIYFDCIRKASGWNAIQTDVIGWENTP